MTPDEAKTVLAAAKESARSGQWDDIIHMLRTLHDQNLLTGTDQGDASFLLGRAYLDTGSPDGASYYFTDASTTAGAEFRAGAVKGLAELTRRDTAIDDETDGVDQSESAAVLAAGDDALNRLDYAEAHTHYRAVYDGQGNAEVRAKAALGIATAFAHENDFVQATQYAEYVAGTGTAAVAGAKSLLTWIHDQQAANAATADGTTVDEYAHTWDAAHAAFFGRDYAQALPLFVSVFQSEQLGAIERAKAAFNAGQCSRQIGDVPGARGYFEFSGSHGNAQIMAKTHDVVAILDRHDQAEQLADELEESLHP